MNEKLNLVEILKDCPKGTKLYSTVFGEVEFEDIKDNFKYPIIVSKGINNFDSFTADGKVYKDLDGECVLFPSKEERDWSKFNLKKPKKPKFDHKTLQPFDKVLTRNAVECKWRCTFYSHKLDGTYKYKYITADYAYIYCIPYNDDTKHLVGTCEEAPEYYRYWED